MIPLNILFLWFTFGFIWYVWISNIFFISWHETYFILFLGVFFCNIWFYVRKGLLLLLTCFLWVLLWCYVTSVEYSDLNEKNRFLESSAYSKQDITLKVIALDKDKQFEKEYKVALLQIWESAIEQSIYGLITIPSNFEITKWDIIQVFDTQVHALWKPSPNQFSYFYYSRDIFFKIYAKSISRQWNIPPHKTITAIDRLRAEMLQRIHSLYPEEEALFLGWILLWAREAIPEDLEMNFNNSWLTHFIAVSWFNITLLVIFLSFLVKPFPVFIKAFLIPLWILWFTLLVWDTAPVIRASLMWVLAYYILLWWREVDHLTSICFVAFIMLLLSPLALNYDVSFQLSFLAVVWIVYTQEPLKKFFSFLPEFFAIREAFVLTLAALVFCLPIIVTSFGQISLLSPFANIAVAWTIPLAMLFGFMSIIVDFVSYDIASWLTYITWIFLAWDIKVVHFFWQLDWAILKIDFWIYRYIFMFLYFVWMVYLLNNWSKGITIEEEEK